ncbi:hypothetical protein C8P66_12165 [Humitalea rosea]|uniref:Uncharacterized protein n=1 Tax=Humitalea rosea TaxID=990373 RepID=A0A2W7IPM4_9PROT|nr:hypothetical protein [Humitalea rosea]PZW41357.1 hypothetical protein C8P66_12165 [Humitalea rosea]
MTQHSRKARPAIFLLVFLLYSLTTGMVFADDSTTFQFVAQSPDADELRVFLRGETEWRSAKFESGRAELAIPNERDSDMNILIAYTQRQGEPRREYAFRISRRNRSLPINLSFHWLSARANTAMAQEIESYEHRSILQNYLSARTTLERLRPQVYRGTSIIGWPMAQVIGIWWDTFFTLNSEDIDTNLFPIPNIRIDYDVQLFLMLRCFESKPGGSTLIREYVFGGAETGALATYYSETERRVGRSSRWWQPPCSER